ncbi:MAG: hypothetical protein IIY55_09810, partial [Blautia sp.]|nr:hypothetical protein [Blautia sp.]
MDHPPAIAYTHFTRLIYFCKGYNGDNHLQSVYFTNCKYTNEPSFRTAESIGMRFACEYPDEINGKT